MLKAQRYLTTFGMVSELKIGQGVRGIFSGDFNGDGIADLATYGREDIHCYLQHPDSFSFSMNTLVVGKTIIHAATGRFNHDRYGDLVVLSDDPLTLQIFLGKPRGKYIRSWETTLEHSFDNILVADVNNDRKADLLLYGKRELGVSVYLGRGNGTFQEATTILPEYSFSTLLVADLQDDGINDLVGTNWISNQVLTFSGFGRLKFSEPSILECQQEPMMLSTALLDSDLNKDLVVLFAESPMCQTFLGDGLGGFHLFETIPLQNIPTDLGVVDLNGDGVEDVGILSTVENSISVRLNNGRGELEENVVFAGGSKSVWCTYFRHGRTRFVDAALVDTVLGRLRILYNANVHIPKSEETQYLAGLKPTSVLCADINVDGWDDLIVANTGSKSISLFLNQGNGFLGGQISYPVPMAPSSLHYITKDDSTAAIIATGPDSKNISVLEINLLAFSHAVYSLPLQGEPEVLRATIDKTTHSLHVFAAEHETPTNYSSLVEFEEISANRFIQRSINPTLVGPILGVVMGDYDGDGYSDIVYVVYDKRQHKEEIFQSAGGSSEEFGPLKLACSFDEPDAVVPLLWSSDLDNDGVGDLILNLKEPENKIFILKGTKDSTLHLSSTQPIAFVAVSSKDRLKILDVDGDGTADVVLENTMTKRCQAFLGKGDGTFPEEIRLTTSEGFGGFDLGNFENGLIPELVLSDSINGIVKIISLKE
ncbi:MAG: VCBS repeat-containing protein [Ignavibacteria bacterium]|nr:VCBS repeat-containing protein [Ignavibacteria bacterium]